MFTFVKQACVNLSAGNPVTKPKWGEKLQSFPWHPGAIVNKFVMRV